MGINVDAQAKALEAIRGGMEVEKAVEQFGLTKEEAATLQNALSGNGDGDPTKTVTKKMVNAGDYVFEFTQKDGKYELTGIGDLSVRNTQKRMSLADFHKENPWLEGFNPTYDGDKFKLVADNGVEFNDSISTKMAKIAYSKLSDEAKATIDDAVGKLKHVIPEIQAESSTVAKYQIAYNAAKSARTSSGGPIQTACIDPVSWVLIIIGILMTLASCQSDDTDEITLAKPDDKNKKDGVIGGSNFYTTIIIKAGVQINIKIDLEAVVDAIKELKEANNANTERILEAIRENTAATTAAGEKIELTLQELLEQAITIITTKQQLQIDNQQEILKELKNIQALVNNIKATVNRIDNRIKVDGKNVSEWLEKILNAVNDGNMTFADFKQNIEQYGKYYLDQIINNQNTQIELQNYANLTLEEIKEMLGRSDLKFADIIEILNAIKTVTQEIKDILINLKDEIADKFASDKRFQSQMIERMDKLQGTEEQQADLLQQILDAIGTLGDDIKQYYLDILNQMTQQDAKIGDMIKLLKAINNNVKKGNAQNQKLGKLILQAISKLGSAYSAQLTDILNAIGTNTEKVEELAKLLEAMNTKLDLDREQDEKYYKEILKAIEKLGTDYAPQLTNILNAIKGIKININTEDILKWLETINNNVVQGNKQDKEYGDKMLDNLDKLIKLVEAGNATMEDIKKIVENTNSIVDNINTKVIHIDGDLHEIKNKMADFTNQIVARINHYGDNGLELGNKILEAILAKGPNVDLSGILARMDQIMGKLDEILEAIKDHDVTVTVNVTGKVTCECKCNHCQSGDGPVHEGILDDLNDLLG